MQRHELDPISLVFGAVFAGIGAINAFSGTRLTSFEAGWVWPVVLLVIGFGLLLPGRRRDG